MSGSSVRAWVNGALVDPTGPALSPLDHAVTVGDAVFETAKVEHGRAFALSRHHARLARSAAGLGLPPVDFALLQEGIDAVLDAHPLDFGRLRYSVTGGIGPLGSDRSDSSLSYIVLAGPQPRPPASGMVTVVPWVRNERSAVVGLKTTSYAENVVALARAKEVGAIEAVFGNTRGELCECTGSNIFVVLDGDVFTPPVESGLLPGITRELLVEWARGEGLRVREETLPLDILDSADEVFITSSTKNVLPVHAVDDRRIAVGAVTTRLADVFQVLSGEDFDP